MFIVEPVTTNYESIPLNIEWNRVPTSLVDRPADRQISLIMLIPMFTIRPICHAQELGYGLSLPKLVQSYKKMWLLCPPDRRKFGNPDYLQGIHVSWNPAPAQQVSNLLISWHTAHQQHRPTPEHMYLWSYCKELWHPLRKHLSIHIEQKL